MRDHSEPKTNPTTVRSLAGRAGRWSAAHRKTAILGWIAFVVAATMIGGSLGTRHLDQASSGTGESGRASAALKRHFPQSASEQVLVQTRDGAAVTAPAGRAAIRDVVRTLRATPNVEHVRAPSRAARSISPDGRSALVSFDVAGAAAKADGKIGAILQRTGALAREHQSVRIEQFGDASAQRALSESFQRDFERAETLSIPITLLILLVAFGSLVAAGIPVLLALSGVAATLGIVAAVSRLAPVNESITSVVLLIGMAVGIDYALFYIRREREERERGHDAREALEIAADTSGRSVLVSGLTVMVAMAGMYFTGDPTFSSFATGTIIVVGVSMLGSVTVLPALLSSLGDRINRGRVPLIGRRRRSGARGRAWSRVLDAVLRRPALAASLATGLLVAMALPAFGLHTATPGAQGLPSGLPIVKTYKRIQAAFPGGPMPAQVVVQAPDVGAPQVVRQIRAMERRALETGRMKGPIRVTANPERTVAVVSVPLAGSGTDAASNAALASLRGDVIPATVGRVAKAEVAGATADSKDFNDLMRSSAPVVFAFVLAMAFLLLLVTFRSIVIPLKAIALNLLSVAAAYGVLVWIFQEGHLQSLLGFHSTGGITSWLPVFLFVVLFGLSMDYHVFILSRVREAYDGGASTEAAVAHGIKATAGVVTSAAVVMVAVFSIFATLGALEFKQMGVGLAVAVLLDATVVRAVLLPAAMKLLGERNWYLPRRLQWLPRVSNGTPRAAEAAG
ncbi:MAG: MMPL family transporter [Solirubrobacteraceae bacterium]